MCFPCDFNFCEAINIFLGGIVVAIISSLLISWVIRRRTKNKYGKIEGLFVGSVVNKGITSSASVKYISGNNLEITVTEFESNSIWTGFIFCYSENLGKIDWLYTHPESKAQTNGIKKIRIKNKDNFDLIGDASERFGFENFTRNKIPTETYLHYFIRRFKFYFDI